MSDHATFEQVPQAEQIARFRALFAQTPSFAAVLLGREHRFVLANPAYHQLVSHRELLGKTVEEALPEVIGQGFVELLDQVYDGGEAYVGRDVAVALVREPGGAAEERRLDFVYQPIRGPEGTVTAIFVEGTDVTDRYLAHEALRESEARNRQILDSAIDYAIIASDTQGRITRWNAGAERILGWSEAEMLGETAERFFIPEDRAEGRMDAEMRAAIETGHGTDERWHLRKSGERFWANGEMTPIRDEAGEAIGFVKVLRDRTEEHRAAEALARSEARLRAAQEAGQVGVFSIDVDSDIIEVTPALCRILGLPDSDTLNTATTEALVLPEDKDLASNSATRGSADLALNVTFRIRRADTGEVRWIARRAEYEQDDAGRPTRLVGVVQDVTEQRLAQAAIAESEARFRALTEVLPNQVWTAALDGKLDWANRRTYDYGGHGEAALLANGWENRVHPDDLERAAAAWARSLASGDTYETEFRLRRADGEYRWHLARAVPLHDADGAVTRWIGTNTDIHDERAVRLELAELNATLEERVARTTRERDRSWSNSRDVQVVVGGDGIFRAVSPAWTAILGHDRDEVVGHHYIEFLHPDDRPATRGALVDAVADRDLTSFENRYLHKDGSVRWISWNTSAEEGLVYAYGRDVTSYKQIEDQLRQAQKMEAVGQLTGGIAHDFNNLLTGMMGNMELLQARIAQGRLEDVDRFVNAAQGAGRRAAALTQRLLAFSRRQTLDPKPTDVNRLIMGMEELVRRTVGPAIELEVVGAAGLWTALIDPGQLENALLNLCINGRDAMPDGGRLTIETANKWIDAREAKVRDLPPGQYLSICVTDTGTGMAPDVIARAFDPFFTTKPIGQGTGLGLSMIYGFARQSGGQVRIYSEVGKGTTMCIYLPRHEGEADGTDEPLVHGAGERAHEGRTVLVVDDEPTVRQLVSEVLTEAGHATIEAADGAAGLKVLETDAPVDLLITDIGLPNGMNGRQVADAARALRPGLKVLFITGYAENAAVGNGLLESGMELLTKPFTLEALARRIADLLEG